MRDILLAVTALALSGCTGTVLTFSKGELKSSVSGMKTETGEALSHETEVTHTTPDSEGVWVYLERESQCRSTQSWTEKSRLRLKPGERGLETLGLLADVGLIAAPTLAIFLQEDGAEAVPYAIAAGGGVALAFTIGGTGFGMRAKKNRPEPQLHSEVSEVACSVGLDDAQIEAVVGGDLRTPLEPPNGRAFRVPGSVEGQRLLAGGDVMLEISNPGLDADELPMRLDRATSRPFEAGWICSVLGGDEPLPESALSVLSKRKNAVNALCPDAYVAAMDALRADAIARFDAAVDAGDGATAVAILASSAKSMDEVWRQGAQARVAPLHRELIAAEFTEVLASGDRTTALGLVEVHAELMGPEWVEEARARVEVEEVDDPGAE